MGINAVGSMNSPISMQQTAGTSGPSGVFASKLGSSVAAGGATGTSGKAVIQAALDSSSEEDKKVFMQSMLMSIGMQSISQIQGAAQPDKD